jgi:hypothetical protein
LNAKPPSRFKADGPSVRIIQSQISGGLSAAVRKWMDNSVSTEEIQNNAAKFWSEAALPALLAA